MHDTCFFSPPSFFPIKVSSFVLLGAFFGGGMVGVFFFVFFNPDGKPGVSDDSAGVTYSDSPFQSHLLLFFPSA